MKADAENLKLADDSDNLLKGFIDLLFRVDGKYYILDWKTNMASDNDYSQESIRKMMDDSDYCLQYKIYTVAVIKWLQKYHKGFDHQKHFGGVFYLFVRGIKNDDSDDGVFYEEWDGDLERVQEEVKERIVSRQKVVAEEHNLNGSGENE